MLSLYLSLIETAEDEDKVIYLYNNYYSYMKYSAMQVMNVNISNVEDVVHDAMISLIDHLNIIDFKDEIKLKNLCKVVARNKAIDYCRKARTGAVPMEEIYIDPQEYTSDPETIVVNENTYRIIIEAIKNLDYKYKDVCLLKYVNELKEQEISKILDIPLKTVNSRIYRGKQILREALRKESCHV